MIAVLEPLLVEPSLPVQDVDRLDVSQQLPSEIGLDPFLYGQPLGVVGRPSDARLHVGQVDVREGGEGEAARILGARFEIALVAERIGLRIEAALVLMLERPVGLPVIER